MRKAPLSSVLFKEKQTFFESLVRYGGLRHAYLFFGDEGVGKFTFASLFARFLEEGEFSESGKPLIDIMTLFPDEKGTISVDAARSVKHFLSQKPLRSARRTVIVDVAEALTPEAQAAFLKIVEEPPASGLMIFIARSPEAFFPPLASRLLKIYFPRLSRGALAALLTSDYGVPAKKAEIIATESHGRIGPALELLKGKKRKPPGGLAETVEEKIMELREKDVRGNSTLIFRLLRLQELLTRYNLNERIQEKAFQYLLKETGIRS